MMGVPLKPCSSSVWRMAPTRPSIMSDGRDNVGAGLGMGKGHVRQQGQRFVVLDGAIVNHAAMAVAGVFAQADIGDDQHSGVASLMRRIACWIMPWRSYASEPTSSFSFGNAKEQHGRNAEARDALHFTAQMLQRPLA